MNQNVNIGKSPFWKIMEEVKLYSEGYVIPMEFNETKELENING